jgi:hypothetical protein
MSTISTDRGSDSTLVRRTLRTVGVLVAACVIFVGVLSVAAVAIASRAVNAGGGAQATEAPDHAKKPLSI